MTPSSRLAAEITAILIAAAAGLTMAPAAAAATTTISPGDRIDYLSPTADTQFCTLGYVYTGTDRHTYAITAGHCRTTAAGQARDKRTGLAGKFIRAIVDPPNTGGADYGLIDFGRRARPLSFIGNTPVADSHPSPRLGQRICHTGVSSGEHCGQIADSHGNYQYLTTGIPPSIGGDSGGPVWIQDDDGYAHVIGIWLGEKTRADGDRHGRFASLAAGLRALDVG